MRGASTRHAAAATAPALPSALTTHSGPALGASAAEEWQSGSDIETLVHHVLCGETAVALEVDAFLAACERVSVDALGKENRFGDFNRVCVKHLGPRTLRHTKERLQGTRPR